MSAHGAIDKETKSYVLPNNATKGREYVCADCDQRVIFRKGDVRTPHFAHYVPSTKCTYYNTTSGESDSHKHAKLLLQKWLRNHRPICFSWNCQKQNAFGECGMNVEHSIEYKDGDEVILEYRSPKGDYIADVAILNSGKVRYIIEIVHSHRTSTTCRPEPWFEVKANDISEALHYESDVFINNCRMNNPNPCPNCTIKQQPWAMSIPILAKRYGQERMWKQDVPCICCKRLTYNPEWIGNRPRQVCKICLGDEPEKVRKNITASIWGDSD